MPHVTRLDVAIVQGMLIVSVGLMFYYLLEGMGLKQMAGLMRVAVVMTLIAVVVPAVWGLLVSAKEGLEAGMLWVENIVDKVTFWR